ncbi:MAG: asparagine synthase B [Longimicrobiales bacterium]
MCSILAILDLKSDAAQLRARALRLSKLQRHRGPDWSGVYADDRAVLAHERLAIVDVLHGAQPLVDPTGTVALAVNGEIYNHRALRAGLKEPYAFSTDSDCEVILALYREHDTDVVTMLNGIFAFVLYDAERNRYIIARDHMGIVPLYTGRDEEGNLYVASEMKALVPVCRTVKEFPPGHVLDSDVGVPVRYYEPSWRDYEVAKQGPAAPRQVREALEQAVRRLLMSDVPYGVLLSGGLDSSIIAAIARRFASRRVEDEGRSEAWFPQLHSFAIGLAGSPDLVAARAAADFIGSVHHEFHFTVQEGLDALSDVIHHLETYDVTTVRAATPMYLMARRIRAMGIKMVLSGEGADEMFGGYLYFHHAPDARAFHEETVRKLDRLHLYDCLRANKAMAAWGVEARVPFLDREFMDVAMSLDPAAKMAGSGRMEKHILREAFEELLPPSVAWRQKEQFSDGVGYAWIDSLRAHAEAQVSERELANAAFRFPHNTPATKEAYAYRAIFDEHFPLASCAECVPGGKSVACSTPEALAWNPGLAAVTDPSGRAVRGVHRKAY